MSAKICWKDEYALGVECIDEQHRQLVHFIRLMQDAYAKQDIHFLQKAVQDFSSLTDKHFKTEEQYMARYAYPELEEHVEVHMECKLKAADFVSEGLFDGDMDVFRRLLAYAGSWFITHISTADARFCAFMKQQMESEPLT